jgi:methyl-accepting chemotaxis protein
MQENESIRGYESISSLRVFSIGQVAASAAGVVGDALIGIFVKDLPLGGVFALSAIAALGGLATWLLLRQPSRTKYVVATYVFAGSSVIAVGLSLLLFGAKTGVPAFFVWPTATAAMLLGLVGGVSVALVCALVTALVFGLQTANIFTPSLNSDASSYIGAFAVALALTLVVVVATVAGGNIRKALIEAQDKAHSLAQAYAQLRDKARAEISAKEEAGRLSESLVQTSTQQQQSATNAATAITQISSQVAELSAAAAQIASAARLIRDVGDRTHEMAEDTRTRLDSDRDQLSQAVQSGEQLQTAARQVNDNVKQMGQILSLITEVAEETHMLSLNATIEATGTGESGRRFRVIAAEVGNLASKVNSSTEQVAAIVQNVQRTVQTMIGAANQAVDSIKRSQVANLTTGEQIDQVSQAASEVAREGFLIVSSTEQQRRSTELIATGMQDVSNVSSQAVGASEHLATIATQLNAAMDKLAGTLPREAIEGIDVTQLGNGGSSGPQSSQLNTARLNLSGST